MKTKTILFIIAAILLVAGGICCLVAMNIVNFDFTKLDTRNQYVEKTYTVNASKIDSLYLETSNKDVTVKQTTGNEIKVVYHESKKDTFTISDSGRELEIINDSSIRIIPQFFIFLYDDDITIYIPSNVKLDVKIKTSNSEISVSDLNFNDLELITSNASIDIENIGASTTFADSSNGDIDIVGSTVKDLVIDTSNSDIDMVDINADNITAKTSNGKIDANKVDVAVNIDLKSSNGSISGEIVGNMYDFSIKSATSNARNSLPESTTGGTKTLKAYTSNAAINIIFTR